MSDMTPPGGPEGGLPPAELPPQPPPPAAGWEQGTIPPGPEAEAPAPRKKTGIIVGIAVVVVVAVIAVIAVASGGGSSGGSPMFSGGHFNGHGVTFDYPSAWQGDENPSLQSQTGNKLWNVAVLPGSGRNLVIVAAYKLQENVDASTLPLVQPQLQSALQSMAQGLGGSLQGDLTSATLDGSPALKGTITEQLDGASYTEDATFVFEGTTEYQIACQYDPDHASTITGGCSQVLGSFNTT
jgi:hypothetical protein